MTEEFLLRPLTQEQIDEWRQSIKYRVCTFQTYLSRRFYEVEAKDTAEARHLASLNETDPYSSRIDPDGEERIVEIRILDE